MTRLGFVTLLLLVTLLAGCASVSHPTPAAIIRHPFAGQGAVVAEAAGLETPDDWLC